MCEIGVNEISLVGAGILGSMGELAEDWRLAQNKNFLQYFGTRDDELN